MNLIAKQTKYEQINFAIDCSEFYNRLMKSWLEKNAIEMYSVHKEKKSVLLKNFSES